MSGMCLEDTARYRVVGRSPVLSFLTVPVWLVTLALVARFHLWDQAGNLVALIGLALVVTAFTIAVNASL